MTGEVSDRNHEVVHDFYSCIRRYLLIFRRHDYKRHERIFLDVVRIQYSKQKFVSNLLSQTLFLVKHKERRASTLRRYAQHVDIFWFETQTQKSNISRNRFTKECLFLRDSSYCNIFTVNCYVKTYYKC
jgi:hypothetical protein